MNYTDLDSTPDTTNNREPRFPGFPGTGSQDSIATWRSGTLRSTLGGNLVNEFKIGGRGGATKFSPEIAASQFSGTPVADQGGFLLNINDVGGITQRGLDRAPTRRARRRRRSSRTRSAG